MESSTQTRHRSTGRPRSFHTPTVLDAALHLFWKRGYRATSTRDLESALDLRQSSIYNAFGSKQELLNATLDRYEGLTHRALLEPMLSSDAGLAAIEKFFVDLDRWITDDGRAGCMLTNLAAEDGGASPGVVFRAEAYRHGVRAAFETVLHRAVALGELKPCDQNTHAELLLLMVLGLNAAARAGAGREEMDRQLSAVRAQLRGWRIAS